MDANVIRDHAAFLDECNGHPLASDTDYHYHGIPVCITFDLGVVGEHSYMLGVLEDGFPVCANQDVSGAIEVAANTGPGVVSGPPDFDAAAETLGISVGDLLAVMPAPPQ